MPVFLISATDERGKRDTHRVEAVDSQDAYQEMEARGFTQIVLHTDDAGATASAMWPHDPDVEEHVSAADMVKFQYHTSFGFFLYMLKSLYWKMRWGLALAGIFLYFKWRDRTEFTYVEIGMFSLLALPFLIAVWVAYFSSSRKYTLLKDAFAWGRWQEVLDRAAALRGQIPEYELTCRESVALAALGHDDEALAQMAAFLDDPAVPRWMYFNRLAEVYDAMNDQDQAVEFLKRSHEDAPENPTVQLDYAYGLLRNQRDDVLAQQLIEQAEQQHLGELVTIFLKFFKGLLKLNQGDFKAAEEFFRQSHTEMQPLAPAEPLIQFFEDLNRAYLAIALAERGDFAQAESLFQQAYPRLNALKMTQVMERYATVTGR